MVCSMGACLSFRAIERMVMRRGFPPASATYTVVADNDDDDEVLFTAHTPAASGPSVTQTIRARITRGRLS